MYMILLYTIRLAEHSLFQAQLNKDSTQQNNRTTITNHAYNMCWVKRKHNTIQETMYYSQ